MPRTRGSEAQQIHGPWDGPTIPPTACASTARHGKGKWLTTVSMRLWKPPNSIIEPVRITGDGQIVGLMINHGDGARSTISVHAAPVGVRLWEDTEARAQAEKMQAAGMDIVTTTGPFGTTLWGEPDVPKLRCIGADGPRWMVRLVTYADRLTSEMLDTADSIMADLTVWRGNHPMGPGMALDVRITDNPPWKEPHLALP